MCHLASNRWWLDMPNGSCANKSCMGTRFPVRVVPVNLHNYSHLQLSWIHIKPGQLLPLTHCARSAHAQLTPITFSMLRSSLLMTSRTRSIVLVGTLAGSHFTHRTLREFSPDRPAIALTRRQSWKECVKLTHLPLDKMVPISQTTFLDSFRRIKYFVFW